MCGDHEHSAVEAAWSAPRAAEGPAVDPVTLPAVDEVTVTTMIDNTFDALLASADDPAVIDDQALVINVRGRGLVVITGCGHAGVVNIIRHAMRLTGVSRLLAVIGGFHLSGPAFEPVIEPSNS
jgi:metal-dependent hydrolase (beta-lactamase superfamily II)